MSQSMRYATNLYTEINEALKPIYLTEEEHAELSEVVEAFESETETDLVDVLERLEKIVIIQQDDTDD